MSLQMRSYLHNYFVEGNAAAATAGTPEPIAPASKGIVFALSGGADSLAMTVAGADVSERLQVPYAVAIVDHDMRPDSAEEAAAVRSLIEGLGISAVHILTSPGTEETGVGGPEAAARTLRHGLLEQFAAEWGSQQNLREVQVLFGQTMEDQAETVLTRLGQGASPRALAAMRQTVVASDGSVRVLRGRPLLDLRRADTERFCAAYDLPWVEDPTNRPLGPWRTSEGLPLPRAAVRHRVLPRLTEALNQDAVPALARVARISRQDEDALDYYSTRAFVGSVNFQGEDQSDEGVLATINVRDLANHPKAVRARVLQAVWLAVATPLPGEEPGDHLTKPATGSLPARAALSEKHVEQLDALVVTPVEAKEAPVGKVLHLPSSTRAKRTREALLIWADERR